MITGHESLQELHDKRDNVRSELEKLRGSERRLKEDDLQDIDAAIEKLEKKLKKKGNGDEVLY